MATPLMGLDLPTPTVTLGPAWATQLNDALEVVDSHDHSTGKGTKIPTGGININGDLDYNTFGLLQVGYVQFSDIVTPLTGSTNTEKLHVATGDLYFTNDSGTAVQITDGGSLVTSPGNAQTFEVQNVSADLIISAVDTFVYLTVDTTAARMITLPLAASVTTGRIYIVKDKDGQAKTNNITIATSGSDLIDGASSLTFDSNRGSVMLVGDGASNWYGS